MEVQSISTNLGDNVRQDIFPLEQWTIITRKGIIMQSKCTCPRDNLEQVDEEKQVESDRLCNICRYHKLLPNLHNMPDMLFNNNLLRLEHFTGFGIEFNALDALKLVEDVKDPLRVAIADGWQSARADFPFAKSIIKPFDWTFTTNYRGTLLTGTSDRARRRHMKSGQVDKSQMMKPTTTASSGSSDGEVKVKDTDSQSHCSTHNNDLLRLEVEETSERIDVNKLKVREEILFYDDITLYEDELADHGSAQYSIKVRVMPKSLFILARFYLRVDGVLARINDTRIYHELNRGYLLREYTNRESQLGSLNLPVSTLINPNELSNHLPLIKSRYEKLIIPKVK